MSAQLSLRPDWDTLWHEDRRLLRAMVDAIGLKQVCFDLDVAKSLLLNALDERDRHMQARWVAYLVATAPRELGDEWARRTAALRGLEVVEAKPVSPEQELIALKEVLTESVGPDIYRAIVAKAKARRR